METKMSKITRNIIEMDGEFSIETRYNDGYTKPDYSKRSWKTKKEQKNI